MRTRCVDMEKTIQNMNMTLSGSSKRREVLLLRTGVRPLASWEYLRVVGCRASVSCRQRLVWLAEHSARAQSTCVTSQTANPARCVNTVQWWCQLELTRNLLAAVSMKANTSPLSALPPREPRAGNRRPVESSRLLVAYRECRHKSDECLYLFAYPKLFIRRHLVVPVIPPSVTTSGWRHSWKWRGPPPPSLFWVLLGP